MASDARVDDIPVDAWKKGALGVVNAVLKEPLALEVVNVFGGGDQEWATVELKADSICLNGECRGLLRQRCSYGTSSRL